jgi:hypothetical protein
MSQEGSHPSKCCPIRRQKETKGASRIIDPEEIGDIQAKRKGSGFDCELTNRMAGVILKTDPNKLAAEQEKVDILNN